MNAKELMILTTVDTITLQIYYEHLASDKIINHLSLIFPPPVFKGSTRHTSKVFIYPLGEFGKLKVEKFRASKKYTKLTFYGLSQYNALMEVQNTLKMALDTIKTLLNIVSQIEILNIDISYDVKKDFPQDLDEEKLKAHFKYYKTLRVNSQKGNNLTSGITLGTKKSRFKIVIYDKQYKNGLSEPLTRFEKTFKEANRKPVTLDCVKDLKQYIKLLHNEWAEELLLIDEAIEIC